MSGVIESGRQKEIPDSFIPGQLIIRDPKAHMESTVEIWQDTDGQVDILLASVEQKAPQGPEHAGKESHQGNSRSRPHGGLSEEAPALIDSELGRISGSDASVYDEITTVIILPCNSNKDAVARTEGLPYRHSIKVPCCD